MDVTFLITTYNRQESCQRLVNALQGRGNIVVINDGCDYVINGCHQVFLPTHGGKQGYWRTVDVLFKSRIKAKYYFMLPDDFMPLPNMVDAAVGLWTKIKEPRKICMSLWETRTNTTCWTRFKARNMGHVWLTQWMDMCFMCEESFFRAIGNIHPVKFNWRVKPNISSGVGAQISRRLFRGKFNLYQVKEPLVIPQESHFTSQMKSYGNTSDSHYPFPAGSFKRIY